MESITYMRVDENYIDFGFAFPTERQGGQNFVRFERGVSLTDAEFQEVKDFILNLPDPDMVLVI